MQKLIKSAITYSASLNAHKHLTALFEYKAPETEAETEAKE